jgi:hypothetical protein
MLPPFLIVMNFVTGVDCYTEISGIIPVFKKINDGTPGCRPVIVLPGSGLPIVVIEIVYMQDRWNRHNKWGS